MLADFLVADAVAHCMNGRGSDTLHHRASDQPHKRSHVRSSSPSYVDRESAFTRTAAAGSELPALSKPEFAIATHDVPRRQPPRLPPHADATASPPLRSPHPDDGRKPAVAPSFSSRKDSVLAVHERTLLLLRGVGDPRLARHGAASSSSPPSLLLTSPVSSSTDLRPTLADDRRGANAVSARFAAGCVTDGAGEACTAAGAAVGDTPAQQQQRRTTRADDATDDVESVGSASTTEFRDDDAATCTSMVASPPPSRPSQLTWGNVTPQPLRGLATYADRWRLRTFV